MNSHSVSRRIFRWCKRLIKLAAATVIACFLLYALIVLIGLVPVNNNFEPTSDGVEIFIASSLVHADIIVPIKTATIDWREHLPADGFSGDTRWATLAAFGWGDKGFYIGTPTWGDLRVSTVAEALLWSSESCMHIALTSKEYLPKDARSITISTAQYEELVEFIRQSLRTEDGSVIPIPAVAYATNDAFYEAHGTYHCFNTCNCWAGAAMRSAGIRTAWFTPLPKTVFLYLD
jgi:uncharacterized protein (TIGR02117 family)